ncbi:hypothetical protein VNO77_44618 [Canavalia gladiata]|uniref:Uncharacterized protein n=1 Tax=Canavalia gladiata TaxID=3824 RepID=A0AAN9PQH7_CANGL
MYPSLPPSKSFPHFQTHLVHPFLPCFFNTCPSSTLLGLSSTSLRSHAPGLQWFTLHHNLLTFLPPIPSSNGSLGPTIYVLSKSINNIPSPMFGFCIVDYNSVSKTIS